MCKYIYNLYVRYIQSSDLNNDKRQCINIFCGESERDGNQERNKRFITNTRMETNAK